MAALKEKYRNEIAAQLKEELGLSNVMEVPRITKITLNMGVGEAVGDKKSDGKCIGGHDQNCGAKARGHQVA